MKSIIILLSQESAAAHRKAGNRDCLLFTILKEVFKNFITENMFHLRFTLLYALVLMVETEP